MIALNLTIKKKWFDLIRIGANERDITLRLDAKYEDRDTPVIQRYGRKLANAIEGTTDKEES